MTMTMTSSSNSSAALASLSPSQLSWIKNLPKAELHAHLNGCVPISVLREFAQSYQPDPSTSLNSKPPLSHQDIAAGLYTLENFDKSQDIHSFFSAFETVYTLISTREALVTATRAVLAQFLESNTADPPECTYLELRTTPRPTSTLSAMEYIHTVLSEVEKYPPNRAALILSLDRRMPVDSDQTAVTVEETIDAAVQLKKQGRRVVGVDLCGDPLAGDMSLLEPYIAKAKAAGLGITLHVAETPKNPPEETLQLLSYGPHRLGHATFLDEEAKEKVVKERIAVELCLSSNLLCKTVPTLSAHHIAFYLERNHSVAVCTDDTLPFRTSLTAEYALLLASPPLGLGLSEAQVAKIAKGSMDAAFTVLN